jgi:ABC-2 type transport system permease protein/sodium transport system permease protein
VRLRSALAIGWPGWSACAAGLLLGLCLWPLAHEVSAVLRLAGFGTLPREQLEQVSRTLERWRGEPVVYYLLRLSILAGLAPLLEELFFRGYLFGALARAARPWTAILTSAVLFGVFHLFMSFGVAIERFPPTALMGVVLGWVRWRSGSTWPGVILHVTHNGVIGLLAYYQPQLESAGVIRPGVEDLPAAVLAVAGVGSALGIWWVAKATAKALGERGM